MSRQPDTIDVPRLQTTGLADIVQAAWSMGQKIDLTGVGYGRVHWGDRKQVRDVPGSYYFFLAGLARLCGAERICEIGTHWGGSTRALWSGIENKDNGILVTLDITTESDPQLAPYPRIIKIVGDANDPNVLRNVATQLGESPIDILYVDADHNFMPTFRQYCLYGMAFRPKFAVFDDIELNSGMREAWEFIQRSVPESDSLNAAQLVPAIRPQKPSPGFGIVALRHNF